MTGGGRGAALGLWARDAGALARGWGAWGCNVVFRGLLRRIVGSGVWARGVAAGLTLEACRFPDLSLGKVRRHRLGTLNARAGVLQSRRVPRPRRTSLSSFLVELDASSGHTLTAGC